MKALLLSVFVLCFGHLQAQSEEIRRLEQEVYEIGEIGKTSRDSAMQLAIAKLPEARALKARFAEAKLRHNIIIGLNFLGRIDEAMDSIYSARNLIDRWVKEASIDSVAQNLKLIDTNIYYDLASTLMNKGELNEAIKIYTECIDNYSSLRLDENKIRTRIAYCNSSRAIAYMRQGDTDAAILEFKKSIELYKETNNRYGLAIDYMNSGNLMVNKDQFKEALETFFLGLKIVQEDSSYLLGPYYINIARVYKNLRIYEEAIPFALSAYAYAEENNDKRLQTYTATSLGAYYMDIKKYDSAKQYMEDGLRLASETKNPGEQIRALQSLAELAVQKADFKEALSWINQGNLILQNQSLPSYELRLRIIEAECWLALNELHKSKLSIDRALTLANKTQDVNIIRDVNEIAHKIYWTLGEKNSAYNFLLAFNTAQDSIFNEEKTLEIARVEYENQLKNETERLELEKQQQAELFEKELEKERLIQQAAIGGGILSLLILVMLFRSNQLKKQKNEELSEKNAAISQLRNTEKKMAEETLASKERELTTITMLSHERNSLLQQLGNQIGGLTEKVDEEVIPDLKEIKRTINSNLNEESWSSFIYQFEKVHPEFFNTLKERSPNLTQHDLRICAYLRVGMEKKEIATISNTTPEAVKKSLYRLKKKMELDAETDLRSFLMQV